MLTPSSVEVLSPAGSPESLEAAVRAGADAVYLGGSSFSARASAKNFTDEQNSFIDKWLDFRNFIDLKEKYKKKQEIKVVKYKLNKMAA